MTHLLRYLFLSYFLFLLSSSSPTALSFKLGHRCLHHERSALLQLQLESMTKNSTRLGFWEPETDCCSWKGITCNITSDHLIGLDLSSMLSAPIHSNSSLFRLSNLQRLNLAHNNFSFTPIPSGLDRLASLTHLNLSESCFSGQIPPEILRLTRLVSLDLSNLCSWEQPLKLERPDFKTLVQNLTSLRELYLDGINISTQSSDWGQSLADALPNLRVLSLSSCGLSGSIHSSLSRLRFLSELRLDGNYFSVVAPSFLENLSHLKTLSLAYSGLHGKFPENVFRLPNLQILDVSENTYLTGHLPDFPPNNAFRVLSFSYTNFHGEIPDSIGNLKFLTKLQLSGCNFSGSIPSSLANLTQLVALNLRSNRFSGPIPLFCSDRVPNLANVDFTNNLLTGTIHSSLFTLPSLQYLFLYMNQLSGQLDEFSNASFSSLERLDLGGNQLTGQIPKSITELSRLRSLYLDSNNLNNTVEFDMFLSLKNLSLLYLDGINLSVKIAKNSFTFPQFETLSLRSCHLNEFPDFLRNQEKLTTLYLSDNQLHGHVPHWIWKRTLKYLDLSNNTISYLEPPLPNHFNSGKSINHSDFILELSSLHLRSCNFSEFPDFLKEFNKLMVLDFSNNQLHGHVPHWIWKRTLIDLNLANNAISYLEPPFPNHYNSGKSINHSNFTLELSSLYLTSCNFSEFPDFLKDVNELQNLDLSNNNIHGQIPNWIWKKNLEFLNLSNNSIDALEQPLSVLTSTSLYFLDLHSNVIQGLIPILSLSIQTLFISNNKFVGEIPELICKMSGLLFFDASHNNLSGMVPECLGNIGTLMLLNLQGNAFRRMPQNFTNSTNLRALNFNGNQIEGHLPRSLANCKKLEVLDIGGNKIFDTFPYWLETLPLLQVLVLRSNKFHGPIEIPITNSGFPMLHIMDLSSNWFIGHLPTKYFQSLKAMSLVAKNKFQMQYIGDDSYTVSVTLMNKGLEMVLVKILTIFSSLDLSSNRFEGEIPDVIGDLKSLTVLNLSHNDLMGQISPSIGNLMQLESLDLSQNKLSGEIPWQLTSLTFLEVLNLSENHLKGSIPRGNQFETFSNTSYEGNPELCGFPLSRKCKDANDDMLPHGGVIRPEGEDSQSSSQFDWKFMLMGYGCGMIIGIVTGYFIIWRKDERILRTFKGKRQLRH